MKKHVTIYISLLLVIVGIAFAAVTADYDRSLDFSTYHTYSWIKVKVEDPLWEDRVTRALDAQLAAKGWNKVADGGDASVTAYGSAHQKDAGDLVYRIRRRLALARFRFWAGNYYRGRHSGSYIDGRDLRHANAKTDMAWDRQRHAKRQTRKG